jgi:hypothetical protein
MAITFNTTNEPICVSPGQTLNPFIPSFVPTSDDPNVTIVTASGATEPDPQWVAYQVAAPNNPSSTALFVQVPTTAQVGDEVTVTYSFQGYDGNGNVIDTGTGTLKFLICPEENNECAPVTVNLGATTSTTIVDAMQFANGGTPWTRIDSIDYPNSNPIVNTLDLQIVGFNGNAIGIAPTLSDGNYSIPVTVATTTGITCETTLFINKMSDTNALVCQPVMLTIPAGDTLPRQIVASDFAPGATAVVAPIGNITAPASNDIYLFGGLIEVEGDLPAGSYGPYTVTVTNANGDTCDTTFTIEKADEQQTGLQCNTIATQTSDGTTDIVVTTSQAAAGGLQFSNVSAPATTTIVNGLFAIVIPAGTPDGQYNITYTVDGGAAGSCDGNFLAIVDSNAGTTNNPNNIINCAAHNPVWENGKPSVLAGAEPTKHIARLLDQNGAPVTLPVTQICFASAPVVMVAETNLGNGRYVICVSAPAGSSPATYITQPFTK